MSVWIIWVPYTLLLRLWKVHDLFLPLSYQKAPQTWYTVSPQSVFPGGLFTPSAPTHTFCRVTQHCCHSFTLESCLYLHCSAPLSLSDTLPVIHKAHSLSHCPQYPSAICNSIFEAPMTFRRDFCRRAYQSVIIACLHVSLSDYTRRSLKTAFLVHLWIFGLSTLLGTPWVLNVCFLDKWIKYDLFHCHLFTSFSSRILQIKRGNLLR